MAEPAWFDARLNRRQLLRWAGVAGAAALVPPLPPVATPDGAASPLRGLSLEDLVARTARYPILLCDDTPGVMALYARILRHTGFTAITTPDPHRALDLCRSVPVSLVLSDIMKPGMNGLEMLQDLRGDPVTRDIPLVFLTARCDPQSRHMAQALGADGYLVKPVLFDEFFSTVHHTLRVRGHWQVPDGFDPRVFAAVMAEHPATEPDISC